MVERLVLTGKNKNGIISYQGGNDENTTKDFYE